MAEKTHVHVCILKINKPKKNYSLRNLCLKTANDKCQIRVATAIHVSVNKTSLLFICGLITWLKSCWCSIKTFIQDTYFFLLWNLGLFWQEFWAIYGKPIWIMLYKYSKIELKPSLELKWAHCWGLGKHHCSCLLPEWWNFTMHYVSIIEIYLKNCIKTIFSQANKDKV